VGSAALVAAVALPKYGDPNFPRRRRRRRRKTLVAYTFKSEVKTTSIV